MSEAIARVVAHAKVLRDSGAPHQQDLAKDLEDVVGIALGGGTIDYASECVRLSKEVERLIEKTGDRDSLEVRVVQLEGVNAGLTKDIEGLLQELSNATAPKTGTTAAG